MGAVGGLPHETWATSSRRTRAHRSWTPLGRALAATGDRWTLLIVLQLSGGRLRLSRLHRCLPGVSTGVLERYVQQMEELELLTRTRHREMPPRVELELTQAGRELLPIAVALSRWGMVRMWSDPGERERVGIELLLRTLPMLVEDPAELPDGTVEAVVVDHPEPPTHVSYRICGGHIQVEHATGRSQSRVEGNTGMWIEALGPAADYARLTFEGERQLAIALLDALPRSTRSVPRVG
ncbi:MAG: helix-turn-helix transcriptional regulator [Solirubrobacterales bacterium]|nr:helix-turn-helix transcriptional regulator [Solirubrobacterales bacterium]